MPTDRRVAGKAAIAGIVLTALLLPSFGSRVAAQSQNVQVLDAGGGNKLEIVRNAAGQVVETRTIDAGGRLVSTVRESHPAGHHVPDQMTTSYYPDGKIRTTAQVMYDPNANFASEVTEQFDQSGKRISGHKLLHDPVTGMFRCWKWNGTSQEYGRVVCPSGEESGEKPPPLKRITRDEAVRMFEAARTAAEAAQKSQRMTLKKMVTPPVTPEPARFAMVLPAALVPGKQVSGSIVENANLLRLRPELVVQDVTLPMVPGSDAGRLGGWMIEAAGSQAQRADTPFSFTVPPGASRIDIRIYPEGQPSQAVTRSVEVPKASPQTGKANPGYVAQVICVAGDACPIAGVFDGNAAAALASFDAKPATIVAETTDMVWVQVPEGLLFGKQLLLGKGNELLAFPVVIVQIDVVANGSHLSDFRRDIKQGDTELVFAGVIGVQSLPEENWGTGMFPRSSLEWARRFVTGFEVPRESRAEREERELMEKLERQEKGVKESGKRKEEQLGSIVYFLKNTTPDVVSWHEAKDHAFALPLNSESFSQGDYRYKFVVEASKTGTYQIAAALIPFVSPVQGQTFTLPADAVTRRR
jgi:hypothetical protein